MTGCMGKLGRVWVRALVESGFDVFAMDKSDDAGSTGGSEMADEFGADRVMFSFADVTDRPALERCEAQCRERLGPAEVLVNNAGIDQPPSPGRSFALEDVPADSFLPTLHVNTFGAFQVAQVFGKTMIERRRGSIINIGSLYASVSPDQRLYEHIECDPPFLKPPAYGASKSALWNLTRYMAAHWGRYGVRVNMLSPGGVEGGQDPEFRRKFCDRVPMGRMAVHDDLVGPLVFLATDASRYITGINLRVDGGFTLW